MHHLADTAPTWLPTSADLSEYDADVLTTTIPRPARLCYELFCDVSRIAEWLGVIRSATIQRRNATGRPEQVAYLALMERCTIGYTLSYTYRERDFRVAFRTPEESRVSISGFAMFAPLGERASLMSYQLRLDLSDTALPAWGDPFYNGHAQSSVMNDFRDFVLRTI